MSVTYDPMTGEPIETPDKQTETGGGAQQITGYDPQTGEPIYGGGEQQPSGYDPQTGQPIYETAYNGTPGNSRPKKKFPVWIPIAAAAAAVLVCVVVVLLKSGLFLGTNVKILNAFANTFQPSELGETLNFMSLVEDGEYTIDISATVEEYEDYYIDYSGINVQAVLAADVNSGKYGMTGNFVYPEYDIEIGAELYLDKKEMAAAVPELLEYTFVYNFTEDKDGYLIDMMEDEGIDPKQIDLLLQMATSQKTSDTKESALEIGKAFYRCYKDWKFESDKSKEYEVDGKKRTCKAYKVVITDDMVIDMLEAYQEVYEKQYDKQMEEMEDLLEVLGDEFGMGLDNVDPSASFKALKRELKGMPDLEATVYLYGKQVAAVVVDDDDDNVTVEFHAKGGDYALQNWELTLSQGRDGVTVEKTGKMKGNVEQNEIDIDGLDAVIEWNYNKKDGSIDGEFMVEDEGVTFEGAIKNSGSEFTFDLDRLTVMTYGDEMEFSGSVRISNKAKVSKPSYKEFDLGNAGRREWEDMAEEIYDNLYDLIGY